MARDRLLKHRVDHIRTSQPRSSRTPRIPIVNGLDEFRPVLNIAGNALRGREAFARVCAACHQLEGVGREIGPNLNSVHGHSPEKLLTSILDPSREVEPRYLAYTCTLSDGEEIYGLMSSETGNGVELKLGDGTTRTVLRSEIQTLQGSRVSLMPDGLEASLSKTDLADLIEYLRAPPPN